MNTLLTSVCTIDYNIKMSTWATYVAVSVIHIIWNEYTTCTHSLYAGIVEQFSNFTTNQATIIITFQKRNNQRYRSLYTTEEDLDEPAIIETTHGLHTRQYQYEQQSFDIK